MSIPLRHRNRRLAIAFTVLGVLAVLAVAGGGIVLYGRTQLEAPAASHDTQVSIAVTQGEGVDRLTDDLSAHGLIRSSFWFGWYARLRGLGGKLHAGTYRLDTGMGASAIVARLEGDPDVGIHRVVLAEGLTVRQMAQRVQAATQITADDYVRATEGAGVTVPDVAGHPAGGSLEGLLFPDTYQVPDGTSAAHMVQMQLDDFARKALPALRSTAVPKFTAYQVLIIASMIQSEARFSDDAPKVAEVVYNRLADGMALDIDSTVMYGLNRAGQAPDQSDLKQDTPYNTYLHPGLPPTPISNPGTAAIDAALHPATGNLLFFVSDACGHNHYSTTQADHDRLVAQYLGRPCGS